MKHAGGRPVKFKNVDEMQKVIDEYFIWCDDRTKKIWIEKTQSEVMIADPAPYTMSGLANRLGLSRQSLLNYEDKDEFLDTIKAARNKVHEDVETRLMDGKAQSGAIFNLKNNFGWKDETKVEQTGNMTVEIVRHSTNENSV